MNTKVVAVLLICLLYTVQAGPYCAVCTTIIDAVIKQDNNNFSNVTPDQLEQQLDAQCDVQFNDSLEKNLCKGFAKQDKTTLLNALKAGKSSQECCTEGGAC
ncbi:hypothetical protein FO519_003129 [Halicephalobus sp. NKZ332]|nr:hypothetical protein FO519_003129 [Halicephalobus sp. NKZ332]